MPLLYLTFNPVIKTCRECKHLFHVWKILILKSGNVFVLFFVNFYRNTLHSVIELQLKGSWQCTKEQQKMMMREQPTPWRKELNNESILLGVLEKKFCFTLWCDWAVTEERHSRLYEVDWNESQTREDVVMEWGKATGIEKMRKKKLAETVNEEKEKERIGSR